MGIGNKIKELRQKQGITQEILARKIGVTPSAVGNYEREISFPKETVLMKLFGALECTPNELLGDEVMLGEKEYAHLKKYSALDEQGRERVDECTEQELRRAREDGELEEVPIAARHGSGEQLTLKKPKGRSILELPDYRGGGR